MWLIFESSELPRVVCYVAKQRYIFAALNSSAQVLNFSEMAEVFRPYLHSFNYYMVLEFSLPRFRHNEQTKA